MILAESKKKSRMRTKPLMRRHLLCDYRLENQKVNQEEHPNIGLELHYAKKSMREDVDWISGITFFSILCSSKFKNMAKDTKVIPDPIDNYLKVDERNSRHKRLTP